MNHEAPSKCVFQPIELLDETFGQSKLILFQKMSFESFGPLLQPEKVFSERKKLNTILKPICP